MVLKVLGNHFKSTNPLTIAFTIFKQILNRSHADKKEVENKEIPYLCVYSKLTFA